jgi:hypothetical protein
VDRNAFYAAPIWLAGFVAALAGPDLSAAHAADVREALQEITDTADKLCGSVATSGHVDSLKIEGDVKAQLSGLAKKLADLGITGTAEITSSTYEGVVQEQLTATLKDVRECKQKVFEILQKKLIPDQSGSDIDKRLQHIEALLEAQNRDKLNTFFSEEGWSQKYPLGFALFYSDGRKLLYSGDFSKSGVTLDPSRLSATREGDNKICINAHFDTPNMHDIRLTNICVSDVSAKSRVSHPFAIGDAGLSVELIGISSGGVAWLIGMRPI